MQVAGTKSTSDAVAARHNCNIYQEKAP